LSLGILMWGYADASTFQKDPQARGFVFTKSPANRAVIRTGGPGLPITSWDPFIHIDDEGYHLFFTCIFCADDRGDYTFSLHPGNQDKVSFEDRFGSIAYAFSNDKGLTWTFRRQPLIYGGGDGWDGHSIETANVIRIGNKLHLLYSGEGKDMRMRWQIGVSTIEIEGDSIRKTLLEESKTFPRPTKPLIARVADKNSFMNNIQEPAPVIRGDRIELFWIGLGFKLPGESGKAPGQAITEVSLGRSIYDFDFSLIDQTDSPLLGGVNIPEVKYWDGMYYMFATTLEMGADFHSDEKIEVLSSRDGLEWRNRKTLLTKGPTGAHDEWGMFGSTVARDGDELVMFYTALEAEDGTNKNPFALKTGERIGVRAKDNKQTVYGGIGRATAPFSPKRMRE